MHKLEIQRERSAARSRAKRSPQAYEIRLRVESSGAKMKERI